MDMPPKLRTFELKGIIRALTNINVLAPDGFSVQLVRILAENLSTDRVTHMVIDYPANRILGSNHIGYAIRPEDEETAGKLVTRALESGGPLVYPNIREHPELVANWADDYETNACAILTLSYQDLRIGALCLSNLTEEQVVAMQLQPEDLVVFTALVAQYTAFLIGLGAAQGNTRFAELVKRINES